MDTQKLGLLKIKLSGISRALSSASPKEKTHQISTQMARNFNTVLAELEAMAPDVKSALPDKITALSPFADMGLADSNYIDLEACLHQVMDTILYLESGHSP
jgi:hypothetical protein